MKVEVNSEGTNRRVILTNRPGGAILPGATDSDLGKTNTPTVVNPKIVTRRACLELCVRRNLLKCLYSDEHIWHAAFEEDGEVVESLFPLRDGHRPFLRGFEDGHVDQLQCRVTVRVLFSVASAPQQ